jgi:hypothetical protein
MTLGFEGCCHVCTECQIRTMLLNNRMVSHQINQNRYLLVGYLSELQFGSWPPTLQVSPLYDHGMVELAKDSAE